MKVQIIYSSLSGNTKKLSEGIYKNIQIQDKSIHDIKDGVPKIDSDIILCGYWVDKGGPTEEMMQFMKIVENKAVGVFCTLAAFADSFHGKKSLDKGIELLKDKNTIIGSYVCNGALSPKLIEQFRNMPKNNTFSITPESELRWEMMKSHPTDAEILLASERFNERILLYSKIKEKGLEYKSVL